MNIDYAEIIRKANARKDALQRFEKAVQELGGEMSESGSPLIDALWRFRTAFKDLDAEAISVAGGDKLYVLFQFSEKMLSTWEQVDYPDPYRKASPREVMCSLAPSE